MRTRLVVGNWKMNGDRQANQVLLDGIKAATPASGDVAVCVPFVYLAQVAQTLAGTAIEWGAQDCSEFDSGAYTGEISARMLKDFGCRYVLVGHSERRTYHRESDQQVATKAKSALAAGLMPIVCVGETLAEREAGNTGAVVKRQLSAVIHTLGPCIAQTVLAYEPVWAIGTGRTASTAEAQAVHALLRIQLQAATERAGDVRILYGGSVKGDNAAALFGEPDIDGGLVGGASLKAADFNAITGAP